MMKLSIAAGSLAIALNVAALPARQVRDVRHELAGSGSISGTVVSSGADSRALARSAVTLSGASLMTDRQTLADDAGRFTFGDLPPGQFTLTARKPNFSQGAYGAARPRGTGTPIPLKDGEHITDIRIALAKWGSISGTVFDPSGEPVEGMSVEGLAYTMRTGRRTVSSVYGRPAFTDDHGVYTISGLDAGEYYVAAGPSPDLGLTDIVQLSASDVDRALGGTASANAAPAPPVRPARVTFAPVFFAGVTDFGNATMLTLKQGEDRTDVDIHLQLVPAARLDIAVTNAGGEAVAGTIVFATPVTQTYSLDLFGTGVTGSPRMETPGHFTYGSLAPGRYAVIAKTAAIAATPTTPGSPPLWARSEVVIAGADQSVALTLSPAVSVTGRIVFDGTSIPAPAGPANIRLGVSPAGTSVAIPVIGVNPAADGTFTLTGVAPGPYFLGASTPTAPPGWALRSAMVGGIDALDVPFEVRSNQSIDGVVVTFTDRPTELSGSLQAANGTPAPDFTIVVFAADQRFWTPHTRRSVVTRPATTGRYTIRNLPPGEYYVAAVTDIAEGDWYDPALLERLMPASTRVTIGEGEHRTLDLKIAGS